MLDNFISSLTALLLNAGVKILIAVVILIVGFKLIKVAVNIINNGKLMSKMDASLKSFFANFASFSLKAILIITVAAYLGVPMASMIAVLGTAAAAVGLALQGGLSNIAGGIMILINRPFKVGDYVECGGEGGTVRDIGLMHTTLVTPDNIHVVIPNGNITSATVKNYSVEDTRRLDLDFSVAYGTDVDKVRSVLFKVAAVTEGVFTDPEVQVFMIENDEISVKFRLRVWCKNSDYWNVKFELTENVRRIFDASGIEIPSRKVTVINQ